MGLTERQEREPQFWNEHAQTEEYANWHEFPFERFRTNWPSTQTALEYLGPLEGKRLLIAAIGPDASVFVRAGAEVWGFDISEGQGR